MTQKILISNIASVQYGDYPGKARFRSRPPKAIVCQCVVSVPSCWMSGPGRVRPKISREDGMGGVKRERDDSVGVLTLDEPASLNAMTPDLLGDLGRAIRE